MQAGFAKTAIISAIASMLLASGLALSLSPPAEAFPYNCVSAIVQNGGTATCSGGSGAYKASIGCQNLFGFWSNATGPWKNVGQGPSTVSCPFGFGIKWAGYVGRD